MTWISRTGKYTSTIRGKMEETIKESLSSDCQQFYYSYLKNKWKSPYINN